MGSEALGLQVNLAILVPVKAVMTIGRCGGESVQSARLENDADCSGCPIDQTGVAGHRPVTDAGVGAELTPG